MRKLDVEKYQRYIEGFTGVGLFWEKERLEKDIEDLLIYDPHGLIERKNTQLKMILAENKKRRMAETVEVQ